VLVRYPQFREGIQEVASQGSIEPEFALQLKYAGDISYKKLQNIFHLIKKKFHINYPTETTIRNIENEKDIGAAIVNINENGKKGGIEGRQVNVRGVLGKILSTERLRNELLFFDEQESLLLRWTIDGAQETDRESMELATFAIINLLEKLGNSFTFLFFIIILFSIYLIHQVYVFNSFLFLSFKKYIRYT